MPKDGDKTGMPKERPIGAKEAKKQRSGKCKARDDDASLNEDLKNYIALQATTKQRHEEYLKTKKRISSDKVEAARLGRETALVKAYQKLISMDTKEMTEEMRAEHAIGLKIIRGKLDDNTN
ncbi:hypothetical protein HU200_020893 [Digitaria exilis]|uniref:No apical meristem-associated C-terminal domain-containing protein n=1 Tax=Digitaria exilis TaxID=1010633 RepID=A0A835KCA1_9POAL|nr:hypothetical protein HU200_020893 [Digitaria exilis]